MGTQALALTQAALAAPADLKGVFEIEAFKNNCVANYEKTTGRSDGSMIFEREKILFMKLLSDPKSGPKLAKCSRFSIYSSMVELFVSGLTLNEGQAYVIPYGEQAQFQIGWKGRLEQMSRMPQIREVYSPEVVMTNELDNFIYTLGEEPRIVQHIPAKNRDITPENKIEWVYVILDKGHRKKCVMMSRQQVLNIRDRYSIPYKNYIKNGGKWSDGKAMDPPFWITDEMAAFKKTVVKRAYDSEPKTARMKALDEKLKNHVDIEDQQEEIEAIDYGIEAGTNASGADSQHSQALPEGGLGHVGGLQSEGGHVRDESTQMSVNGGESEKAKRTRRTKAQIEADNAAKEQASRQAETITTAAGNKVDTSTGEVVTDVNPVDDLPSLDELSNL